MGREQKGSGKQVICFHANRREYCTEHIRKIGNTVGYGIVRMVVLHKVLSTRKSRPVETGIYVCPASFGIASKRTDRKRRFVQNRQGQTDSTGNKDFQAIRRG